MKAHAVPRKQVRYHLRVPLTAEHWAEESAALMTILEDARIDEALFFVPHAEERSTGLGTFEEIAVSVERLRPLFGLLRGRGVDPSINIWWTASFSHFPTLPRVQDSLFAFRWAVNPEGQTSRCAACPGCDRWQAHIRRMYAAYASLEPVRIWIDDDVHTTLRADMHAPCFCETCMGEMARRTGQEWTRESLLKAIMKNPPNPVRDAWLDFQESIMLGVADGLAKAVHAVSPETRVCLMHSNFEYHSAEGRHWARLIDALGQPKPTLRPSIGPYIETTSLGIAEGLNGTRLMQEVVGDAAEIAPEIENYPHSRFGKSAAIVKADLEMAQLFGIRDMTFSIYRFGGRLDLEVRRSPFWQRFMGKLKPRLQVLADLGVTPDQQAGVSLFHHEDAARRTTGVESLNRPVLLLRRRPWDAVLPILGFPVRFGTGPVTAFSGESIALMPAAERERIFSGGVLLDAGAADTLLRLGAGALAGLGCRKADAGHSHEILEDAAFGGLAGDIINTRWEGPACQFEWLPGARPVSMVRGYDGKPTGNGVVLFENALGGRVAVYPYDGQSGTQMGLGYGTHPFQSPSFLCAPRQAQLRDVLTWLGRTPMPLVVHAESPVYPMLARQEGRWIAAVAALSADGLDGLDLELAPPPFRVGRVRLLGAGSRWRMVPASALSAEAGGNLRLRLKQKLACLEVAVVVLEALRGDKP